jgi:hypothetical protein
MQGDMQALRVDRLAFERMLRAQRHREPRDRLACGGIRQQSEEQPIRRRGRFEAAE